MMSPLHAQRESRRTSRSFTLTELIVVIVILGILAAIAVPAYLATRGTAHDASTKSNVGAAHRTAAAFGAQNAGYGSKVQLLAYLNSSEPELNFTDDPTGLERHDIYVDTHDAPNADDEQTVHLCGLSPTGFAFCLAANQRGRLDLGPTVNTPTVYRAWGADLDSALCHLPTEASAPGDNCAAGAVGGSGWATSGAANTPDSGSGDLGAGDGPGSPADMAVVPTEGSPWRVADIPDVGAHLNGVPEVDFDDVLKAAPSSYLTNTGSPFIDGIIGEGASSHQVAHVVTDDEGNLILLENATNPVSGLFVRKLDVASNTITTMGGGLAPGTSAPVDGAAGQFSMKAISAMAWGGGRVWLADYYYGSNTTSRAVQHFRVLNPRTGDIETIKAQTPPSTVQYVHQMAYSPTERALYWVYTRGNSALWRLDIDTGVVTDRSVPSWDRHQAIAYDHTTDRLIVVVERNTPHARALVSYNSVDQSHTVLTGGGSGQGQWSQRSPEEQALPDELFEPGATAVIVTKAGSIILSESQRDTGNGTSWNKSWVRQLDRASGTLKILLTSPASNVWASGRYSMYHRVAIAKDGYLYEADAGSRFHRVKLTP